MKLSIANLTSANAFSSAPVEKVIEWKGNTMTTYVRHLSYQTAIGRLHAANGADPIASRIAASICDEFGNAIFNVSDITGEVTLPDGWKEGDPLPAQRGGLDPELTELLLAAIADVQKLVKPQS